ncbi:MAG: energy coupling factor transporter S component ThiW [Promethearchaeota archaeon]
MSKRNKKATKQIALGAMLIATGIALATLIWFPFLGAKAFPVQHMINAIGGVFLGPIWAAFIATAIGSIRNILGTGTIYAFPGGIPGGMIVGLFYLLIVKAARKKHGNLAALTEPIGTVFIGATLSVYVFAPLFGDLQSVGALIPFWISFATSSIPGSIIGFIVLQVLEVGGIDGEYFRQ